VTAYYLVSEALTNAAKHADCPLVEVAVTADGDALRVEVRDAGRGGADPARGSGLLGLRDRVEAIGGTMRLTSPPARGTSLSVELPLRNQAARRLTTRPLALPEIRDLTFRRKSSRCSRRPIGEFPRHSRRQREDQDPSQASGTSRPRAPWRKVSAHVRS
jgi:Histidine kinase-, DNA gyrase B-, and HSP90-like ATPase